MRTAERERLAEAIEAARAAERAVADAKLSAERAADGVDAARRRHAEALERLESAKEARVARYVRGGADTGAVSLREARAAEADASDDLAVTKLARDRLASAVEDAEQAQTLAERAVEQAARNVLAGEAPRLLLEARAAEEAFRAKLAEVHALRDALGGSAPAHVQEGLAEFLGPFRREHVPPLGPADRWMKEAFSHAAGARWRASLAALATDPEAALPSGAPKL